MIGFIIDIISTESLSYYDGMEPTNWLGYLFNKNKLFVLLESIKDMSVNWLEMIQISSLQLSQKVYQFEMSQKTKSYYLPRPPHVASD